MKGVFRREDCAVQRGLSSCRLVHSRARRHSSVVEQLFRKQQVLGSSPSVGSSDLNVKAGLRAGFFASVTAYDAPADAPIARKPRAGVSTWLEQISTRAA